MNIKLLLKSIFKELFSIFKTLFLGTVFLGILVGVIVLYQKGLLEIWVGMPLMVILIITTLFLMSWIVYDNIKERYKKEIQNKDLEEKEFEVRYKVVYAGVKTMKAKDKSLISLREFDKRNDNEYSEIKIVKVKER